MLCPASNASARPDNFSGDAFREGTGCRYIGKDSHEGKFSSGLIVGVSVLFGVLLLSGLAVFLWVRRRRINRARQRQTSETVPVVEIVTNVHDRQTRTPEVAESSTFQIVTGVPVYPYHELSQATDTFREDHILGSGGQGTVYRGYLTGRNVAIKRCNKLNRTNQKEFENEVRLLAKIDHPNVVKVFGYSLQLGPHPPCIVYELVEHGTLSSLLHSQADKPVPWPARLDIALGTSEAIKFMHTGLDQQIIHRDIKSLNILLDINQQPKVGDFGISRMMESGHMHVTTDVVGTFGYIAPELHYTRSQTTRQDVFSFGVVLCEIVTGKKAIFQRDSGEKMCLYEYVLSFDRGALPQIMDRKVFRDENMDQMIRVAQLARRCCAKVADERPKMDEVTEELKDIRGSVNYRVDAASVGSSSCKCDSDSVKVLYIRTSALPDTLAEIPKKTWLCSFAREVISWILFRDFSNLDSILGYTN